jgi:hypothetical protein
MKVRRLLRIWPLRPTVAASGLQLCCWLAAGASALALATAPTAGPSSRLTATVRPDDPHLLILQRRCIDRIIWQAEGQPEDIVVRQVNQHCYVMRSSKRTSAAGLRLLSCERPFTVRVTPGPKRVAGCLGG